MKDIIMGDVLMGVWHPTCNVYRPARKLALHTHPEVPIFSRLNLGLSSSADAKNPCHQIAFYNMQTGWHFFPKYS